MVQSKLDYCNSLLYKTSLANIQSLQRIQNNLASLVILPSTKQTQLPFFANYIGYHRITYTIACLPHSTHHTTQPLYMYELLQSYKPTRSLHSSHQNLIVIHQTSLCLTDQSFHVAAPSIWNSLPENIIYS